MPRLPYELNRPIFESLGRKELFKVVTVSRHFQFEGERLIYRDISLRSNSYQVRSDLRDLYGTRRFHHYIQSLLLESVDEDVETEMGLPPVFSYELASLLEKLTALVFLSISFVRDGIYDWNFCGNVFRHCKFRRRRFRCDLALDSDLQAFLAKQPEITEWIWSPKVKRTTRLPASTLPNLSALYVDSMSLDYEVDAPMLVSTRPVTHFGWYGQRLPPDLILCLSVSAPHLRVLFLGQFHFMEGSVLAEIADFFPNLEGLARVDYKEKSTCNDISRFHNLQELEVVLYVSTNQKVLANKIRKACPSIHTIHVTIMAMDTIHKWDDKQKKFISTDSDEVGAFAIWVRRYSERILRCIASAIERASQTTFSRFS